jgi:hypothetical protein
MADRSDVRLAADVTLERERESFSNLAAIRKIVPENNVLTACSACSFWRTGAQIRLARIEAETRNQSEIAGKHPNKVSQSP